MVGHDGAGVGRGVQEPQQQTLAARHLRVVPDGRAGEPAGRQARHERERLRGGERAPPGDLPCLREAVVAVAREQVVDEKHGRERRPAARGVPRARDQEAQRRDELRSDREQSAPLERRLAQPKDVEPLQVAQPAVDRLQAVPGSAGAEVLALHQRDREPALRGVPRHGGAVDAAPDDDDVPFPRCERREIALHARPAASPFE